MLAASVNTVYCNCELSRLCHEGLAAMGGGQAMTQQATRHARRCYVGGLPPTANEQTVATFFSGAMAAVGGASAGVGDCVVNVYINQEKKFAFVEFRTVEEASNCMALDGIVYEVRAHRVGIVGDLPSVIGPLRSTPVVAPWATINA
eukprot:scaffold293_cov267-Prasinococcus_capsulatus_cf.AAC.16